jgi:hypothetical protein
MKRFCVARQSIPLFLLLSIFIFSDPLFAQTDSAGAMHLLISCNKTTSLVFPQIIKSIDRGSRDLFVQKVAGVENVLQVKAAKENFRETNMTVITANGKLYSFILRYAAEPSQLNIQLDSTNNIFEKIAAQKKSIHGVHNENYDMVLRLKGIFIEKDILYYQLELKNLSNVPYDIDMTRFYIKDKKQSRRTATQELEQFPQHIYGNTGTVDGQSKQTIVVALPKFTIPDKKIFYVQVIEKNGGRNLRLKISNRKIVKARTLLGIY